MKLEKVIDGILRYLNAEIYGGMNDWQEVLARFAVSRMVENTDQIKNLLTRNAFLKTLSIMDSDGNIDVDGVIMGLREQIAEKGKISFTLPLFGTFTFKADDVDNLHRHILGG